MKKVQLTRARLTATALIATLSSTMVSAVSVPSSAEPAIAPIAISGSVNSSIDLTPGSIVVEILPEQDLLEDLPSGTSVQNSLVPEEMIETNGDNFSVRVPPAALPDEVVSETGLVSFQLLVLGADGGVLTSWSASARVVMTEAGLAWTDPLSATVDLEQSNSQRQVPASVRKSFSSIRASGLTTKYSPTLKPVVASLVRATSDDKRRGAKAPAATALRGDDDGEVVGKDDIVPPIIERPNEWDGSCPPGGAGAVYGTKRRVSTTIGTAYPIGGDSTWMTHNQVSSDEFTGSYGVAFANGVGASFGQSNTKTVETGGGFDWDPKNYARAYRVQMVYQQVKNYYGRCQDEEPYTIHWYPMYYSGGYGEKTGNLPRPDWDTCARIGSTGTWWRSSASGSSYELSYGVDISGVIGIDMSSKRAYNGEAKLGYDIGVAGRRMCGSGGRVPSLASKVMERVAS